MNLLDVFLSFLSAYGFWMVFIFITLLFLLALGDYKNWFDNLKSKFLEKDKTLIAFIATNLMITSIIILMLYSSFLFYLFFIDTSEEPSHPVSTNKSISLKLTDCKGLQVYYPPLTNKPEQAINIILKTDLDLPSILNKKWIKNKIFDRNKISFSEYIKLLKRKAAPVSSLSFKGYPQDYAYQQNSSSLSKREHIRFWESNDKPLKKYYGSISYDDGYTFNFYNYFYTPTHKIDKKIDKSRDFFKHYLLSRTDLNVTCSDVQTSCKVKELLGDNEPSEEQRYYTDGKILTCTILQNAFKSSNQDK